MFSLLRLVLFSTVVYLVHGQNLGVPTGWRKPNNTRELNERVTLSQDAINQLTPKLNTTNGEFIGIGYWQSGNVWSAMANHDHSAGTTTYKTQVVNNLKKVFNLHANYDKFGSVALALEPLSNTNLKHLRPAWWATAAYYAYRAYGDATLLSNAEATWNHVSKYVITDAEASSGSTSVKSFTLSGTCNGTTMAGGVFWRPAADNQAVNSITTGLYAALSAFLATATQDAKYTNAAIASVNWIKNLNINANNRVLDTVNGHDCSRSPAGWVFTYNTGKFIEALSVLSDVTGDTQWNTLMVTTGAYAMKNNPPWQNANGIITEGSSLNSDNDGVGFKSVLIRGLLEAYKPNPSRTAFRTLIQSYIDVQYNALLDLAATGNDYSPSWNGPAQGFTAWGQMAALDVMVAAVSVN